jgi:dephospho-CoA kinase
MLRIGLTGSIGSGKSTLARILRQRGVVVLDADEYAREAAVVLREKICAVFPGACLEGDLDRRALARMVFEDAEARTRLEAIIHPYVRRRFDEETVRLSSEQAHLVVYEIPLLFERGWEQRLDGVLVVAADDEARIERVMQRNGISREEVLARDAVQTPQAEKVRRANWVLWNDGDEGHLEVQVQDWMEKLLS